MMLNNLSHWAVILSSVAVLHVLSGPHTPRLDEDDLQLEREEHVVEEEVETSTEDMGTAPPIETGDAIGPTLGDILSKFSLGKLPKMQREDNCQLIGPVLVVTYHSRQTPKKTMPNNPTYAH